LRDEVALLRAEIRIGLVAGCPELNLHTVTYVKNGNYITQVNMLQRIAIGCVTEP